MLTNTFKNLKNPYVQTLTDIPSVLDQIKTGYCKNQIITARTHGKGQEIFEQIKSEIPTFSPNACFYQKRTTSNIKSLSGFIYLDIDHDIDPDIFHHLPFIYSYWKSFSGKGLGVLVSISGLTVENFKYSWTYLTGQFHQLNCEVDTHTKDIARQCIISYDPEIYINPDPIPLIIPILEVSASTNILSSTLHQNYYSTCIGLEKIKYNTTLDDYNGMDYIVIEQGKEFRDSYLPRQIHSGQRHKWLGSYTSTLLFNNPYISYERLERELLRANNDHCHPKLDVSEVIAITTWSFSKHTNHTLNITANKKKIWINPESKLSTREKRSIIGKETGKLRKTKTLNELVELYLKLQETNQKITQKLLQENSNLSILTIKKYWHEIHEKVYYVPKKEKGNI